VVSSNARPWTSRGCSTRSTSPGFIRSTSVAGSSPGRGRHRGEAGDDWVARGPDGPRRARHRRLGWRLLFRGGAAWSQAGARRLMHLAGPGLRLQGRVRARSGRAREPRGRQARRRDGPRPRRRRHSSMSCSSSGSSTTCPIRGRVLPGSRESPLRTARRGRSTRASRRPSQRSPAASATSCASSSRCSSRRRRTAATCSATPATRATAAGVLVPRDLRDEYAEPPQLGPRRRHQRPDQPAEAAAHHRQAAGCPTCGMPTAGDAVATTPRARPTPCTTT
jgi:hypothetical protein